VKGFGREGRALPWWPLLKECIRIHGVKQGGAIGK
jgi:hypothetical protein